MAIQISIIGVNRYGEQIDEVFGYCSEAIDFMEQIKEERTIIIADWEPGYDDDDDFVQVNNP